MSAKTRFSWVKKLFINLKALLPYLRNKFAGRSKSEKSKLVFIFSFPRSGTHALGSLLTNDSIGFHYYGEFFIFNAWHRNIEKLNHYYPFFSLRYHLNLKRQRKHWKYMRFGDTTLNARKTLQAISRIPGTHIIKIFPLHLPDEILNQLLHEFKPHVIMWRRNHLDRYVSHRKANATGVWHKTSTSEVEIEIDQVQLDTFITDYTRFYQHFLTEATSAGCQVLDADFSYLQNPERVREIQKFVAFDDFSKWELLPPAPTTFKQDKANKVQQDYLARTGKKVEDFDFLKAKP